MIVPMERQHAERVAEIHCAALAGDFLPSLGPVFLTVFYRAVLDLNAGFGFVSVDSAGPVGFVLGSLDTTLLFRRVVERRALVLAWHTGWAVLRRPSLIRKVFETFRYPGKEGVVEKAELVVIGCDSAHRGKGAGRQLVKALNSRFAAEGVRSFKVSVLQSNQGANGFYQALGFQRVVDFELYEKRWNLYTRVTQFED